MKNIGMWALILGCSAAWANQPYNINFASLYHKSHFALQVGHYWSHQGRSQHINIETLIGDDFTIHKNHDSNQFLGLGYFIDGEHCGCAEFSYGINAFYFQKATVKGFVIQEDLFENLSYRYKVRNFPIYAEIRAHLPLHSYPVSLTTNIGLGPNFLATSNFSEHSLDGGITLPDHIFASHSSATFTATFGVGLQWDHLIGQGLLECGYRFFYLGKGHLNKRTDQVVNVLKTGSVYANAVLCSLSG